MGNHEKHLGEVLLISTHNIKLCFHGEIRKISTIFGWKTKKLSRAMV